jgi:hypothetical protein
VYCGFDELVGHLDLLAKTKSKEFSDAVLSRVGGMFYNPNDPTCVVLSHGVLTRWEKDYADEMAHPPWFTMEKSQFAIGTRSRAWARFGTPAASMTNWFEEYNRWTPVSPIKFLTAPPIFQPNKKDSRYHWISKVTLAQLLRRTEPRRGQTYGLPEERIHTKEIDVEWSCDINRDTAEFSNPTVDHYTPKFNDSFVEADWRSRATYDLPRFPELDQTNSPGTEAV